MLIYFYVQENNISNYLRLIIQDAIIPNTIRYLLSSLIISVIKEKNNYK